MTTEATRLRRPPPEFMPVVVEATEALGPRMTRVWLGGADLTPFAAISPAASLRLLLPEPTGLVLPAWTGNEFHLPDGRRPGIRTLTPGPFVAPTGRLAVDVVLHDGGRLSDWAVGVAPGDPAAVSGPGRGYEIDTGADGFLLAGDETAIPAINGLLAAIPAPVPVEVLVEISAADARVPMPDRPHTATRWLERVPNAAVGDAMTAAVADTEVQPGTRVWVAGEAAAVQRIRRDLLETRDVQRERCTIRGYWKYGREGT